ncbi:amidohydrolase [Flindersiella endophytica]
MTSSGALTRLPAFVDAHVHLSQTGFRLSGLGLEPAASKADLLAALETYARGSDDAVILGFGWDETAWPDQTLPTSAELDRAAPGRVVLLSRVDGHSSLVSGALLARAPRIASAEGWNGTGRTERDANHHAREAGRALLTRAQRKAAIARALDAAAAAGIGCVHEMAAPHINDPEDILLIRELAEERPGVTVVPYWGEHVSDGGVARALELGCAGAAGDLNVDGAFGSRTAGLLEPYADRDGHHGHVYLPAEAVAEHVIACTKTGLQAGFHCIGDAGTAAAAEGFRLAEKAIGAEALRAARHRLEHAESVDSEDFAILAECGVALSVQPAFDAFWGGESGMYAQRLGAERALATNPFAAFARAGLVLAFGSDSPVTPMDPWGAIRGATGHHNPGSRLTYDQALAAHTRGGRWAGKLDETDDGTGDYAEWDLSGEQAVCMRTVVGGRTVYARE